jgi:nucleoside-diphosphate-sugar epimerase
MKTYIAGGHGTIALLLTRILVAKGHEVVGIIRNPAQVEDLQEAGATALVLDLEATSVDALAGHLADADATVFAAGAGPGSGPERKRTVDRDGAILLADASVRAKVRRMLVVSAMRVDEYDPDSSDVWEVYKAAKAQADAYVRACDLDWTIVRPGSLTNDPPWGTVTVGDTVEPGSIPRADVAAVFAELLASGRGIRRQFEVVSGDTPIEGLDP